MRDCEYYQNLKCIFPYYTDSCYEINRVLEKNKGFPQIFIEDSEIDFTKTRKEYNDKIIALTQRRCE